MFANACEATGQDEQPGEDELEIGDALDLPDAVAEHTAEDRQEERSGDDRRQDRLRPERENPPHLPVGERRGSPALRHAKLDGAHARIASR